MINRSLYKWLGEVPFLHVVESGAPFLHVVESGAPFLHVVESGAPFLHVVEGRGTLAEPAVTPLVDGHVGQHLGLLHLVVVWYGGQDAVVGVSVVGGLVPPPHHGARPAPDHHPPTGPGLLHLVVL